jgi:3alpha(or 20beta)-hydroxysteroid dehydrogenase
MFTLAGKVAVITGGGSGIGLATARRFVEAEATVIIANRSDSSELARSFGASFIRTDVSQENDVQALMDESAHRHGRIDVVVNSAGIADQMSVIGQLGAESFRKYLDVNLMGVFFATKYAASHMTAGGAIVNVSSLAGMVGFPSYGAYAASKAAVISLTRTAAAELAPCGIRVNCVCPGSIDTPMLQQQEGGDTEIAVVTTAAPMGRIGKPEEVAALIHFLSADDCAYITGQIVAIDGGINGCFSAQLLETVVTAKLSGA